MNFDKRMTFLSSKDKKETNFLVNPNRVILLVITDLLDKMATLGENVQDCFLFYNGLWFVVIPFIYLGELIPMIFI